MQSKKSQNKSQKTNKWIFWISLTAGAIVSPFVFFTYGDVQAVIIVVMGIGFATAAGAVIYHVRNTSPEETAEDKYREAIKEGVGKMDRIRYDQKITLNFSREIKDGEASVIVRSVHEFTYKGRMKNSVSIFNDFRGLSAGKTALQDLSDDELLDKLMEEHPKFHFIRIDDDDQKYSWSNACDELDKLASRIEPRLSNVELADKFRTLIRLKNNKLFYEGKVVAKLPERSFAFQINGEYATNDRLIWCIQDISENFIIRINIDKESGLKCENFRFTLNHPLEEQIMKSLNGYIELDGTLKKPEADLLINHVVLPYQSFEISWKVD